MNSLNGGAAVLDLGGYNALSSVFKTDPDAFKVASSALNSGKPLFISNFNLDGGESCNLKINVLMAGEDELSLSNRMIITPAGFSGPQPQITAQPEDASGEVGDLVTFSCTATGSGLTYQWQYQVPNGTQWINSSQTGYNTNTLADVEIRESRNGQKYRCRITDKYGTVLYTRAAVMTVTE